VAATPAPLTSATGETGRRFRRRTCHPRGPDKSHLHAGITTLGDNGACGGRWGGRRSWRSQRTLVQPGLVPTVAVHLALLHLTNPAGARAVSVLMDRPCLDSKVTTLNRAWCRAGVADSHSTSGRAPPPRERPVPPTLDRPRGNVKSLPGTSIVKQRRDDSGRAEPSGDTHSSSALEAAVAILRRTASRGASHLHGLFRSGAALDESAIRSSHTRLRLEA
jgi:hypothetical protein